MKSRVWDVKDPGLNPSQAQKGRTPKAQNTRAQRNPTPLFSGLGSCLPAREQRATIRVHDKDCLDIQLPAPHRPEVLSHRLKCVVC